MKNNNEILKKLLEKLDKLEIDNQKLANENKKNKQ
jgi:hypothetical protein